MKIPYDTLMEMPVHTRKSLIMRHNLEQEQINERLEASKNGKTNKVSGEALNAQARMEQRNAGQK